MIHCTLVSLVAATLMLVPVSAAAKCDFLPKSSKPSWVGGEQSIAGSYTGVGQASKQAMVKSQLELAKQAAIRDLANNIEVSVRNDLVVSETLKSGAGAAVSDTQIESITKTTTQVSLADVRVQGTWLDRRSCLVWIRVEVDRNTVERQRQKAYLEARVQKLDEVIEVAQNDSQPIALRKRSLVTADALLSEIDFASLEGGLSKDFYLRTLKPLRGRLQEDASTAADTSSEIARAKSLILEGQQASGLSNKARKFQQARKILQRVSNVAPFGQAPDYWAERAAWELGQMESASNSSCAARLQFTRIVDLSNAKSWTSRARRAQRRVACSEDDQKKYVWRKRFENRSVQLECAYQIENQIAFWHRVCDDVASFLGSHGAVINTAGQHNPADIIQSQNAHASGPDLILLRIYAVGKVKTRPNSRGGQRDYQFTGKLSSRLFVGNQNEFSDRYSGVGGWNPISENMAIEVVALQAARRWQDKFYQHLVGRER